MIRPTFIAAALALSLTLPAHAQAVTTGGLKISAPWSRATPKGATIGGGYMKIMNTGNTSDRLLGGASDIAARFEMHEMSMDNGVMKMRPVAKGIEIKPGQTLEFKPAGFHVMFVGLKRQLAQGAHFKATLEFEKAGKIDVDFTVEGIGAQGASGQPMPGMQMKH